MERQNPRERVNGEAESLGSQGRGGGSRARGGVRERAKGEGEGLGSGPQVRGGA